MYGLFDSDGNGVVDFMELSSGLTVLCGRDRDSKIEDAFALFDYNGDRVITLEEMAPYLTSLFKVIFHTEPLTEARLEISVEELALATAEQAFMETDLDTDGNLSFKEFKLCGTQRRACPPSASTRRRPMWSGTVVSQRMSTQDRSHLTSRKFAG